MGDSQAGLHTPADRVAGSGTSEIPAGSTARKGNDQAPGAAARKPKAPPFLVPPYLPLSAGPLPGARAWAEWYQGPCLPVPYGRYAEDHLAGHVSHRYLAPPRLGDIPPSGEARKH